MYVFLSRQLTPIAKYNVPHQSSKGRMSIYHKHDKWLVCYMQQTITPLSVGTSTLDKAPCHPATDLWPPCHEDMDCQWPYMSDTGIILQALLHRCKGLGISATGKAENISRRIIVLDVLLRKTSMNARTKVTGNLQWPVNAFTSLALRVI